MLVRLQKLDDGIGLRLPERTLRATWVDPGLDALHVARHAGDCFAPLAMTLEVV